MTSAPCFSHPDFDRRLPARGSTVAASAASGRGLASASDLRRTLPRGDVPRQPLQPPTTGREFHPTPKQRRIRPVVRGYAKLSSVLTVLLTRHGHTDLSEPEQYLGQH